MNTTALWARYDALVPQLCTRIVAVVLNASACDKAVLADLGKDGLGRGHVRLVKRIDSFIARLAHGQGVFSLEVLGDLDFVRPHGDV